MDESMGATAAAVWLCMVSQARDLRRVNVPVTTIIERTELDHGLVAEALDELGSARLVSTWDAGDDQGEAATLTPEAADRLGLKLRRTSGGMSGFTWQPLGQRDHRVKVRPSKQITATDLGIDLDHLPGSEATPAAHAEARESVEKTTPARRRGRLSDSVLNPDRLPRPTSLLDGPEPWTVEQPQCCPACDGERLGAMSYCLRCDRWGLDWLLGMIRRDETKAVRVTDAVRTTEAVRAGNRHRAAS